MKMKIKSLLVNFASFLPLIFVVSAIVSYLWNLIAHGAGSVEWELSIRLAIILGIVLAGIRVQEGTGDDVKNHGRNKPTTPEGE